jgi:hypothetical protein
MHVNMNDLLMTGLRSVSLKVKSNKQPWLISIKRGNLKWVAVLGLIEILLHSLKKALLICVRVRFKIWRLPQAF